MATRTAARRSTSKKKSRVISVDMTGVETGGGGSFHIPAGDYKFKVLEVESGTSKNDNEQIEWVFEGLSGKAKGKKFFFYTTLTPESLWKLRETLEGLGVEVPDEPMDIDLDELVDLECMGSVEDDEYQGKIKSRLARVFSADEEEEEEEPAPRAGKGKTAAGKGKSKTPKLSTDEVKAMDEDELQEVIDKYEVEVDLADFKTLTKKRAAVLAALEEGDHIED